MFKPMLAATLPMLNSDFDFSRLIFPLYASPKLDGIRMTVQDGVVKSRTLKPIKNLWVQETFGKNCYNGLDGELIYGSPTDANCFNTTTSATSTINGPENIDWYVFDCFHTSKTFEDRLNTIQTTILNSNIINYFSKNIHLVTHLRCKNINELLNFEKYCLDLGYEGIMLNGITSPYKQGRSTLNQGNLVKMKRFTDSEGLVIDFEEGEHNGNEITVNELGRTSRSSHKAGKILNNTLGALVLKDIHTSVIFKLGTGFSSAERQDIWDNKDKYIGKLLKYKYQHIGLKDKPRIPSVIGWRSSEDV